MDMVYIKKKGIDVPWDSLYSDMLDYEILEKYSKSFPSRVLRYVIENIGR